MEQLPFPAKEERHRRFGSVHPLTAGTKPTEKENMKDLQNQKEDYLFSIEQVGITRVQHPLTVISSLAPYEQTTVASLELTTSLPRQSKGINMSRLTEELHNYYLKGLSNDIDQLCRLVKDIALRMEQRQSAAQLSFPWFYERSAPKTGQTGLNSAQVYMKIEYDADRSSGPFLVTAGLTASVTTLCPCSKEISEYSAHNQRGMVTIRAKLLPQLLKDDWMAMLLDAAESNASAPLHPVLKRPDEKRVTEQAYENPRFVEDLVRLVAADLYEYPFIESFTVECRNEESIHQHDAVARISFAKNAAV